MTIFAVRSVVFAALASALAGCMEEGDASEPAPRPVRVQTVAASDLGAIVTVTGDVQAEREVAVAFRIGGRLTERPVNVGDRVAAGTLIARLDSLQERSAVEAARAALVAAEGELAPSRNVYDRHAELLARGFTTRARYEETQKALQTAQARTSDAEAQLETARDQLAFTEVFADSDGVVTARGAEPGEVVAAGQTVVRIARDDGRDAVFNLPARLLHVLMQSPTLTVRLADAGGTSAVGRVRQVSPEADPATGTFEVRVGLQNPPAEMRLGASVVGEIEQRSDVVVSIPASALTRTAGRPAVFVVEGEPSTAALRPIEIASFAVDTVVVSGGLQPDDVVVVVGMQALHPGQRVAPLANAQ